MIKPILICNAPKDATHEQMSKHSDYLKQLPLSDEYHVLILRGSADFVSFEILKETRLSSKKYNRTKRLIKLSK